MKAPLPLVFGLMLFFTGIVPAQTIDTTPSRAQQQRNRDAFEAAAESTPATRIIHQRFLSAEGADEVKILEDALLVGDRSVIHYLKARRVLGLGPAQYLDIYLVKFGETEYVDLAIEETKSENRTKSYWATWRLIRFKTKESYRRLYEMLDDKSYKESGKGEDYGTLSVSETTMDLLYSGVENPPKDQFSVDAWKEWFRKNNLIE